MFLEYKSVLEANVRPSVWQLKLGQNCITQEDNDPKHSGKSASEWMENISVVQSMSRPQPDWNAVVGGTSRELCTQVPANVSELEGFMQLWSVGADAPNVSVTSPAHEGTDLSGPLNVHPGRCWRLGSSEAPLTFLTSDKCTDYLSVVVWWHWWL